MGGPAAGEQESRWETLVRDRYGGLAGSLTAVGVFQFFQSPLFIGLLAVLVLTTLVCTLNRWPALWRGAWRRPGRPSDAMLDSAPHVATIIAAPSADLPDRVRRCLADRGFRVISETGDAGIYLRGDRNALARLASLVDHLAVILLLHRRSHKRSPELAR